MNCNDTQRWLEALIAGRLAVGERTAVQAHLDDCEDCRELLTLLRLDAEVTPDLTASILERTAGSPCEQARDRLCDHTDLQLESLDRGLMNSHLAHCPNCDALSAALLRLKVDLPTMAELEVPSELTASILQATRGRTLAVDPWADRLTGWAVALWNRPRLAWEAGYLGAMLMWVFVSVSGADLQASLPDATDETRQTVQQLTQSASHLGQWARDWTGSRSTTAIAAIRGDIEPTVTKVGGNFEQTLQQISGKARYTWTRLTVNDEHETEGE